MRPDDPESMKKQEGKYTGKIALIVLGGQSGRDWKMLYDDLCPDVLLIANGVNTKVENADYWCCVENMARWVRLSRQGDPRAIALMEMFYRDANAKIKLVSHHSWAFLQDTKNCIRICRDKNHGEGPGETPDYFSFRHYGQGFLNGWLIKHRFGALVHVGTVGVQLLHLAGILGCAKVHTIGFDLHFPKDASHHWYKFPPYQVDVFRKPEMFTEYEGLRTMWVWVETAQFLQAIKPLFERDKLAWYDHSDGLLQRMGVGK
jgi:hypothetical protein